MIIVTLSVVCTLKGMSRWSIQRIKAIILYIVYGVLFVDTVDMKIKACNALNAMFVETVDTLVFVALTQHLIQSTMRCENYSALYKVASCTCQEGMLFVEDTKFIRYLKCSTVKMCVLDEPRIFALNPFWICINNVDMRFIWYLKCST